MTNFPQTLKNPDKMNETRSKETATLEKRRRNKNAAEGLILQEGERDLILEGKQLLGYKPMRNLPDEWTKVRLKQLGNLITKTEKALKGAPQGSLCVRHHKGNAEFYQRMHGEARRDIYISKRKNKEMIQKLAQKDYNQKALKLMKQQKKEMEQNKKQYFCGSLDEAFENLDKDRRALVTPVEPTTKQYVKMWIEQPYSESKFPIDPEKPNYTDRGESVRSKSEVLIANALYSAGIPYKYECPLRLGGNIVRPDFTILDLRTRREIFLEHFGMMDDPEYLKSFLKKINLYETNNIFPGEQLICTFESSVQSLDTRTLKKLITHYLV